jgi:hypothetical protein
MHSLGNKAGVQPFRPVLMAVTGPFDAAKGRICPADPEAVKAELIRQGMDPAALVLSGFLPDSDVLSTLPPCLAPASYRRFGTGSLRDCVRSPGDQQKLADMFCNRDYARATLLINSDEAQMALPIEFSLPSQRSLCDPLTQSPILCDPEKAEGDGSPANGGRRRDVRDNTNPVLLSSPPPK